jgi:hypothetical protein
MLRDGWAGGHLRRRSCGQPRPLAVELEDLGDVEQQLELTAAPGRRYRQPPWRPADNYQPGPATWDWRLHALGCERTAARQPDELGFRADVKRIFRDDDQEGD